MDSARSVEAFADPAKEFEGTVVVAAPHMDDEVLACGGTIARLPDKERIHCIYATDGSKSPAPIFSWLGSIAPDLASTRMREARTAMAVLGVPENNLHFLRFPDGELNHHIDELSESLTKIFKTLRPSCVLIPFRYDRHPDHLALNRAATHALQAGGFESELFEYFVYYRWSLLPGKDLRRFIRSDQLIQVDIQKQATQKRQALECYRSQTTLFSAWQDRPIIPRERVTDVSRSPEYFLKHDPQFSRSRVFKHAANWIRLVHLVEPVLKKQKERFRALTRLRLRLSPKRRSMFEVRCSTLPKLFEVRRSKFEVKNGTNEK